MVKPRATTKKIAEIKCSEKTLKELKCYIRKYLLHIKEKSEGVMQELIRDKQNTLNKMADVNLAILIIALNENGFSSSIKRYTLLN